MAHKFVIKVSLEGVLVGCWLDTDVQVTEDLGKAAEFDSVVDAVQALILWRALSSEWVLGCEVIHKGLCTPNPCSYPKEEDL